MPAGRHPSVHLGADNSQAAIAKSLEQSEKTLSAMQRSTADQAQEYIISTKLLAKSERRSDRQLPQLPSSEPQLDCGGLSSPQSNPPLQQRAASVQPATLRPPRSRYAPARVQARNHATRWALCTQPATREDLGHKCLVPDS